MGLILEGLFGEIPVSPSPREDDTESGYADEGGESESVVTDVEVEPDDMIRDEGPTLVDLADEDDSHAPAPPSP